jgi:hypothetical protein
MPEKRRTTRRSRLDRDERGKSAAAEREASERELLRDQLRTLRSRGKEAR